MFATQWTTQQSDSIKSTLLSALWVFTLFLNTQRIQADEMSVTPKMVRIEFETLRKGDDSNAYQYLITTNQEASSRANNISALKARMKQLVKGDIVLLLFDPLFANDAQSKDLSEVSALCHDRAITLRFLNSRKHGNPFSDANVALLAWSSPYENPRDLENTTFFVGMKVMGRGPAGYEMAMKWLLQGRPARVLLVGSDYTQKSSYARHETPFDEQTLAKFRESVWLPKK